MQKKITSRAVTYSIVSIPLLSQVVIGHTATGVCVVEFQADAQALRKDMQRLFPNSTEVDGSPLIEKAATQLTAYCNGELRHFSLPLDLQGTAFRERVWQELLTIPYGDTATYSDIAGAVDNPKGVRAVAQACGANPVAIIVPCHRIIGKDGSLTGYSGGLHYKKMLLELEGIL